MFDSLRRHHKFREMTGFRPRVVLHLPAERCGNLRLNGGKAGENVRVSVASLRAHAIFKSPRAECLTYATHARLRTWNLERQHEPVLDFLDLGGHENKSAPSGARLLVRGHDFLQGRPSVSGHHEDQFFHL